MPPETVGRLNRAGLPPHPAVDWPLDSPGSAEKMGSRVRRSVAVLALILLVSGCGATQQHPPAPPAGQQTASPAPSPTPSELSLAQAKARYLEIVAPYNTALEKLESAANAGRSWTVVRTLAGKVAEANAAHARQLRATPWPAELHAPMAALLVETDAAQRYWQRAAQAKSAEELGRAIRAAAGHSGKTPATQIRAKLGLPPYSES